MNGPDEIGGVIRRLRVVWLALLLSVATLNFAVWIILRRGGIALAGSYSQVALATAALLVVLLIPLAPMVRRRIQSVPRDAAPDHIIRRWQAGWFVGQAIKEAVGIVGLVIALVAGSITWAWTFAAVSLASMILTPPWEHELRLRIHRVTTAPGGPGRMI